jgi:hypothetical protein
MPMEWPENTYVPAFLAPRLRWVNERWVPEQDSNTIREGLE